MNGKPAVFPKDHGRVARLMCAERRAISLNHEYEIAQPRFKGRRRRYRSKTQKSVVISVLNRMLSLLIEVGEDLPSLRVIDECTDRLVSEIKKIRRKK